MCVLNASFRSKVRSRIFGCISMCSTVLFILRSRFLIFRRVLREQSASCFVLSRKKLYVGMVVCISLLHSCLCVMVMSSA